jgi:N-methylhydantoinase A
VLGRLNPVALVGGAFPIDASRSHAAVATVAAPLGGDVERTAAGIVALVDAEMAKVLRIVSVERGHDPRDFTLVAFGGGGGMHAVALATELGMRKVVIPFAADVFSAWGMLMSDLRRDYFVTRLLGLNPGNAERLDGLLGEVTGAALEQFGREGVDAGRVRFLRYGNLRYENQEHGVEVQLPDGPIDAAAVARVAETFHESYEREYTYRLDAPIEFVGTHVVAVAEVGKLAPAKLPTTGRTVDESVKGRREVDYATEGVHTSDVYDGALLEPGMSLDGPAIIETKGSTVVVHPGNALTVDEYGNLIITIAREEQQ